MVLVLTGLGLLGLGLVLLFLWPYWRMSSRFAERHEQVPSRVYGRSARLLRGAPRAPGELTAQSWAAVFRTSGTTGPSKRVPVTHENLIEMARKMERWLGLTSADRSASK